MAEVITIASERKRETFELMDEKDGNGEIERVTGEAKVECRNGDYAFRQVRCPFGYRNRAFPDL
jgi:hypothetical protein